MSMVCDQDTRVDILQEIRRWVDEGQEQVFWLVGSEGTGKSRIAGSVAHEYYGRRWDTSRLMASFLFSHEQEEPTRFVTTVAVWLAREYEGFKPLLEQQTRQNDRIKYLPMLYQWQECILTPLSRMERGDGLIFLVIIDALDMCPETEREQVLQIISDTSRRFELWSSFFSGSNVDTSQLVDVM